MPLFDLMAALKSTAEADQGRDWLALAVAAYGAIVATGVAFYQFVRDRPGVRLIFTPMGSVVENPDSEDGFDYIEFWHVRTVNHRKRRIELRAGGLLIRGRTRLHPMFVDWKDNEIANPFPVSLEDGESVEFHVQKRDGDRVTGAWASDVLERYFTVRYPARNPRKRFIEWRWSQSVKKHRRKRGQKV